MSIAWEKSLAGLAKRLMKYKRTRNLAEIIRIPFKLTGFLINLWTIASCS